MWYAWRNAIISRNDVGLWQCSSNGKVDGIPGNVDLDYALKGYPTIIKSAGSNGFEKPFVSEPEEPDPGADVPERQRAAFSKLAERGVITTPEHWKGRLAQQTMVDEIMAIVANTVKDQRRRAQGMDEFSKELTIEVLPSTLYEEIAEAIGVENFVKLANVAGGSMVYVPKPESLIRPVRDAHIKAEFNGYNHIKLVREYDVTEWWIRQACGEGYPSEQLDTFGFTD